MLYLAQVVAYTGILWLLYMLLLRNRPMHAFNRAYLLVAAVLPIVLPLLKLPETVPEQVGYTATVQLPAFTVSNRVAVPVAVSSTVDWMVIIYSVGCIAALVLLVVRYVQIRGLVKRAEGVQLDGYTLLKDTGYGPGSWGRYVFLPDTEVNDTIIRHEVAHVRLRHTADIMLLSILQCLIWPNLFLYAIKKELKQVHEFQADAVAGTDTVAYSKLLLASLFDTCTIPFAHSFIIHPIKRRIMMLNKKRNKSLGVAIGMIAILAAGAVLFNVVMLQSCASKKWAVVSAVEKNMDDKASVPYVTATANIPVVIEQHDQSNQKLPEDIDNTYAKICPISNIADVDEPASLIGGIYTHLLHNLVYPKVAIEQKIEGRVTVKFVVDEEGKVVRPEIIESPDTSLSAATMEIINKMPLWEPATKNGKPVATELYLPVNYTLDRVVRYTIDLGKTHSVSSALINDGHLASVSSIGTKDRLNLEPEVYENAIKP